MRITSLPGMALVSKPFWHPGHDVAEMVLTKLFMILCCSVAARVFVHCLEEVLGKSFNRTQE